MKNPNPDWTTKGKWDKWIAVKWRCQYCGTKVAFKSCRINEDRISCLTCNGNKGSMNVEEFRKFIEKQLWKLNFRQLNRAYRICKRYRCIKENLRFRFYFEAKDKYKLEKQQKIERTNRSAVEEREKNEEKRRLQKLKKIQ